MDVSVNPPQTMTGGEAMVAALLANGVDTVFGLPGVQTYGLFDALHGAAPAIRTVSARHEQAAAYMAYGYARSSGRVGVFSVVPGPGLLNASAALCTAWGANVPVLCLTAQIPSAMIGRRRGALHELPDQLGTMRSIVKWAERIERVSDAPGVMNEAFRRLQSGRPGPVVVEMPWDVLESRELVSPLPKAMLNAPGPLRPVEIHAAAELIRRAERPMIVVGSGALGAEQEVRALAEHLGAPVTSFRGGRGVVSEGDPLGLSSYAAYKLWPDTDVLIGIGTRLELPFMRWNWGMERIDAPVAPPHIVRIDIDPAEMHRFRAHASVLGDAAAASAAILEELRRSGPPRTASAHRIARAKVEAKADIAVVKPHIDCLAVIRELMPDDGFIIPELSQIGFTTYFGYEVRRPRTYVTEGFQGTLGFGFLTALGVKVANPDTPVISLTGDGGFLFGLGDLATAVHERIGLVTIVVNNGSYWNVERDQHNRLSGRQIAARLTNPDFMELARSFGIACHRVSSPEELRARLPEALANAGPTIIEIRVEPGAEVSPWPFIHPPRPAPAPEPAK